MKFSIRDLFLVTLIVALCVAWWLDRGRLRDEVRSIEYRLFAEQRLAAQENELAKAEAAHAQLVAEIQKANASSRSNDYPDNWSEGPVRGYTLLGPPVPNSSAPAPSPPKP